MTTPTLQRLCLLTMLGAAATTAQAQDMQAASAAFQRGDLPTVIELLLPAEQAGRLNDAQPLMQLALACEQASFPPRNRRHECHKRRAEIMVKAAELGNAQAMFAASIGLMDSGLGRIGIRLPFVDDGKRVDALMWALLAARFATDDDQYRKASARAADLARPLAQEWRGQETLGQRAMRMAEAKRQAFESAGLLAYNANAGAYSHDDYGMDDDDLDFEIPMVEDRQAIQCGGVIGRGGSVTVNFGPKRAREEAYDFGVWRESDGELFYLSVDWGRTTDLNFIAPARFRESRQVTVPTSVTAPANGQDTPRKAPVFTTPGTYSFYISSAFDSHEGGYLCKVEYRP